VLGACLISRIEIGYPSLKAAWYRSSNKLCDYYDVMSRIDIFLLNIKK
jgi:hypothetical protein